MREDVETIKSRARASLKPTEENERRGVKRTKTRDLEMLVNLFPNVLNTDDGLIDCCNALKSRINTAGAMPQCNSYKQINPSSF